MNKKFPLLLVTLSAIFWGANFNVGKILVGAISPLDLATIRFVCSCILIIPIILLIENRADLKQMIKRNFWIYSVLSLIGIVGYNGLFFQGLKYTTPINAALIMATNPPLTLLLAAIFLKESMNFNQKIGALMSLIGVGVVIAHGSLGELLHLQLALGDLMIMMANICWALYGVLARRYLKQSSPLMTTASTMFIGSIILLLMTGYDTNISQILLSQTPHIYRALLYMIVFGTVLAYLFWNYGISQLGAGNTAIFFNLIPVVTTVIAIFLGEIITPVQLVGGMGVIFGVLLSTHVLRFPIGFLRLSNERVLDLKKLNF
jgi:drug/metabolite transporter (DMT)-like permease